MSIDLTPSQRFVAGMANAIFGCDCIELDDGEYHELREAFFLTQEWAISCLAGDMRRDAQLLKFVAPLVDVIERDVLPVSMPGVAIEHYGYAYGMCAWTDSNPFDGLACDLHTSDALFDAVSRWFPYMDWFNHYELWTDYDNDGQLRPRFNFH